MSCHICLGPEDSDMIKCKLCCDGLEQDACPECAKLYANFKKTVSRKDFEALAKRRLDGIKSKERL